MKHKKSSTVGAKIWMLSGALLLNLLLVGAVAYWNSSLLSAQLNEVAGTHLPAVRTMTLADMMHDGIRANVFHSIIVSGSKEEELKAVRAESEEFAKNIHDYLFTLQSLPLPAATRKAIEPAIPEVDAYVASAKEIVDIALSGKVKPAMEKLPGFNQKFEILEKSLGTLGELIEGDAQQAQAKGQILATRSNYLGLGLIVIGLAIGTISAFAFIRTLQKSLNEMISELAADSEQVDRSAVSLRQASQNLSDSSARQASALQETASCVDQITAMVNKTAENSRNLEETANESNESARKGQESIGQMLEAMKAIRESQTAINDQVEKGNEKITEIVKVISEIGTKTKVINDIVFQTKLLSFNASVEAARAGEHGKGFSVVAEEVGNLAQMSGNAAKEISDMLTSSVERVDGIVNESRRTVEGLISGGKEKLNLGEKIAEQCGEALNEIVKQVSQESSMINEITTAIQEQNQGIKEISKAIQMLDQSTQQNSVMSTETAGLSSSLLEQAAALRSVVQQMEAMVAAPAGAKSNPGLDPTVISGEPNAKVRSSESGEKKAA